jgi:hypothetical protein
MLQGHKFKNFDTQNATILPTMRLKEVMIKIKDNQEDFTYPR